MVYISKMGEKVFGFTRCVRKERRCEKMFIIENLFVFNYWFVMSLIFAVMFVVTGYLELRFKKGDVK